MWGVCSSYCGRTCEDDHESPDTTATLVCNDDDTAANICMSRSRDILQDNAVYSGCVSRETTKLSTKGAAVRSCRQLSKVVTFKSTPDGPKRERRKSSKSSVSSADAIKTNDDSEAKADGRGISKVKAVAMHQLQAHEGDQLGGRSSSKPKAVAKKKAEEPLDTKAQVRKLLKEAEGEANCPDGLRAALDLFSEAIKLEATNPVAWAGRGGVRMKMQKQKEALADLDEALRLDANLVGALSDRAEVKSQSGDLDGCIDDYNKYLTLAPCDGRALYKRGNAKLQNGFKSNAEEDFRLARRLGYTERDLKDALKRRTVRGGC